MTGTSLQPSSARATGEAAISAAFTLSFVTRLLMSQARTPKRDAKPKKAMCGIPGMMPSIPKIAAARPKAILLPPNCFDT